MSASTTPGSAPFDKVAVCVDASEAAADAVALGIVLAGAAEAITVVHALETYYAGGWGQTWTIPDDDWRQIGDAVLDAAAAHAPGCARELLPGNPHFAVAEWVEKEQPEVVVCAAHSGLLARAALGSMSAHFAYHLECPVAIARPERQRPRDINTVAACIDGNEGSQAVLETAARVSAAHDAMLSAVHVADDLRVYVEYGWAPDSPDWEERWRATMDELVGDLECERVVLDGTQVGPTIRDWADDESIDLLVLAAHRKLAERMFVGGVAGYLAHHSSSDLLISR